MPQVMIVHLPCRPRRRPSAPPGPGCLVVDVVPNRRLAAGQGLLLRPWAATACFACRSGVPSKLSFG